MSEDEAQFQRARALIDLGRFDAAEELLSALVARAPNRADAWTLLSVCYANLGKTTAALSAAERALSEEPDLPMGHMARSAALLEVKRGREAVLAAEEAVRLLPDSWQGYAVLADAQLRTRHLDLAAVAAERACTLGPEVAAAHFTRGVIAQRQGRRSEAVTAYRRALELDPGLTEALNNLGVLELKRGRSGVAFGHFRSLARLNPRSELAAPNVHAAAQSWLRRFTQFVFLASTVCFLLWQFGDTRSPGLVGRFVRPAIAVVALVLLSVSWLRAVRELSSPTRRMLRRFWDIRVRLVILGINVACLAYFGLVPLRHSGQSHAFFKLVLAVQCYLMLFGIVRRKTTWTQ
jgi:Flp pilus assembly protein TadD